MCRIIYLFTVLSFIAPYVLGDFRIVGGNETTILIYPSVGSMLSRTKPTSALRCGCTILNERLALTAAHCCDGATASKLTLRFGSSSYKTGGELYNVETLNIHPEYNSTTLSNDVCIVSVDRAIVFDSTKQPVVLYSSTADPANNTVCKVVGFGTTSEGGNTSAVMRVADVPYVDRATCNNAYNGSILPSMICAGVEGKDSCQGDSGGLLECDGKQTGIVSWGEGCARAEFPGVYTFVGYVYSYITNFMATYVPPPEKVVKLLL